MRWIELPKGTLVQDYRSTRREQCIYSVVEHEGYYVGRTIVNRLCSSIQPSRSFIEWDAFRDPSKCLEIREDSCPKCMESLDFIESKINRQFKHA